MATQSEASTGAVEHGNNWVAPARAIEPVTIRLSAIDNLTAPVYPSPCKFFPLRASDDPLVIYERLKRGLARTIWVQPHLSGRLEKDDTGRASVVIPEASEQGVEFVYADLRDDPTMPSYEQFRENGFPFADGDVDGLHKLRRDPYPSCQDGEPLIAPQMSVIRGGMILNLSICHTIGDLVQCKSWIGIWARCTRALAEAQINGQPEPPMPPQTPAELMDRSRLTPKVEISEDLDSLAARAAKLPHMVMLDPRDPDKIGEMISELFNKARLTDSDLASRDEDELRTPSASVWSFPVQAIKKLQGAALQASPAGTKLSQIDCLTAFTWQRLFLAKWAPAQKASPTPVPESTRIIFAGSVRHRLTPPLPQDYLPACVDLFPVTATTSDFLDSSPESLAKAAKLVRTSNEEWSEADYIEMCELAQAHPMNPGLIPKGPIDILVTDHTRGSSDLLENWGPCLGLCEALREPYLGRIPPGGEITLLPRWGNGTVEVMVAAESVALERLRRDPLMNAMSTHKFTMHDFVEKMSKNVGRSKL